jgi:DNA-binding response OmpR family regulator
MEKKSYEELDELLAQIRLLLLRVRQSDPATADELKSRFSQLEFWLESLIVESLKLKELESAGEKVKVPVQGRAKTPGRRTKAR